MSAAICYQDWLPAIVGLVEKSQGLAIVHPFANPISVIRFMF